MCDELLHSCLSNLQNNKKKRNTITFSFLSFHNVFDKNLRIIFCPVFYVCATISCAQQFFFFLLSPGSRIDFFFSSFVFFSFTFDSTKICMRGMGTKRYNLNGKEMSKREKKKKRKKISVPLKRHIAIFNENQRH